MNRTKRKKYSPGNKELSTGVHTHDKVSGWLKEKARKPLIAAKPLNMIRANKAEIREAIVEAYISKIAIFMMTEWRRITGE